MKVGDLVKTIYSNRTAIVTEVNALPTWNQSPFGVKFTYMNGEEGMQPSDKIRLISTSVTLPVQFIRDWTLGWWRGDTLCK